MNAYSSRSTLYDSDEEEQEEDQMVKTLRKW